METTIFYGAPDWRRGFLFEQLKEKEILIQFIAFNDIHYKKLDNVSAIVKPKVSTLRSVYCNVICRNSILISQIGVEILFTDVISTSLDSNDIMLFKLEWEGY